MRLPTGNRPHLERQEDARQVHEALYNAFSGAQARPIIPTNPEVAERDQLRLSGALHRFWTVRGFRLRSRQLPDKAGIELWLEMR